MVHEMANTEISSPPTTIHTAPALDLSGAERAYRRLCQRALWSDFGTIGFDAYKAWVLDQPSIGGAL